MIADAKYLRHARIQNTWAILNDRSGQASATLKTREHMSNFIFVPSCAHNRSQQKHLICLDTTLFIKNSPTLQQVCSKKPASNGVQVKGLQPLPVRKLTKPFNFLGPTSPYSLQQSQTFKISSIPNYATELYINRGTVQLPHKRRNPLKSIREQTRRQSRCLVNKNSWMSMKYKRKVHHNAQIFVNINKLALHQHNSQQAYPY